MLNNRLGVAYFCEVFILKTWNREIKAHEIMLEKIFIADILMVAI